MAPFFVYRWATAKFDLCILPSGCEAIYGGKLIVRLREERQNLSWGQSWISDIDVVMDLYSYRTMLTVHPMSVEIFRIPLVFVCVFRYLGEFSTFLSICCGL